MDRFTPSLSDQAESDFRARLMATRMPDPELVADWSQGLPIAEAGRLRDALLDHDFRRCLSEMEELGSYSITLGVLKTHVLLVDGPKNSTPIILTHGWPGGVIEFLDVARALSQHHSLVIPSLPGFGFSEKPRALGMTLEVIANLWAELMQKLGHERYIAQGGDWGSEVSVLLAQRHPEACIGAQINLVSARPPANVLSDPTEAEAVQMQRQREWGRNEMAYFRQQAARPQTLGYAIADSPMGQAAWIAEKFHGWTDPRLGQPYGGVDERRLLDLICTYWFSSSATSSSRLYWESGYGAGRTEITAPVSCANYPHEINAPSRRWADGRFKNIVDWHVAERGGHFPALEVPDDFVADVLHGVEAILAAK